jgi:hypothetical protein
LFDLFRLRKGRGFASAVPDLEIMMCRSCFCTRILRHYGANVCVSDNYGKNNEYYLFKFVLREVLYYLNGVVADTIFQGFLDGLQRGVLEPCVEGFTHKQCYRRAIEAILVPDVPRKVFESGLGYAFVAR